MESKLWPSFVMVSVLYILRKLTWLYCNRRCSSLLGFLFPLSSCITIKLCRLPHIFPSFPKWNYPTFLCVTQILYHFLITIDWTLRFFHILCGMPHILASFSKWKLHLSYLIFSFLVNIISLLVIFFVFQVK